MHNLKFFLLLFFPLVSNLQSSTIKFNKIKEFKINKNRVEYIIEAKSKKTDLEKLKKFRFFNKKTLLEKSSYYLEGNYSKKNLSLNFKKGYFLEGNFIVYNIEAKYKNRVFKAKEAIIFKKSIAFKNVFLTLKGKKYRKINYKLRLE